MSTNLVKPSKKKKKCYRQKRQTIAVEREYFGSSEYLRVQKAVHRHHLKNNKTTLQRRNLNFKAPVLTFHHKMVSLPFFFLHENKTLNF